MRKSAMSGMRSILKSLDEIQPSDAPYVGGKALQCASLKQAGFPVPDGIVLTTDAMDQSLDIPALQHWLASLPSSAFLAVRSSGVEEDSAGHSFAGIHETTLNVTPPQVPDAVRSCWDSVRSEQARAYRRAQKLSTEDPRTAVLIQRMIQPVAAGVAFTVNPITGAQDEMVINSAPGLGEALVSGQVNPDEFRIHKTGGQILSTVTPNGAASLTMAQLQELAAMLVHIERYYGNAQDVEWCHDGRQFWIVQSRPVTTVASHKDLTWTRANAREVFPDLPSPITIFSMIDTIEEGERRFNGKLFAPENQLGRVAHTFYGRLYFNVDQIRYACRMTGTAPALILRSMGHEGSIDPADEITLQPNWRERLTTFPDIMRILAGQVRVKQIVREQTARLAAFLKELESLDFRTLPDCDLWTEHKKWLPRMGDELQVVFTLTAVSAYEHQLRRLCERVGMTYERLAYTHLAAGEKSVSSAQAFDLLRLARAAQNDSKVHGYFAEAKQSFQDYRAELQETQFLRQFDRFLEMYGHRGHYESDIAMPRYHEDPSPLLCAIQTHVQSDNVPDPVDIIIRQNKEAAEAWNEFRAKIRWWQRPALLPITRRIKQYYLWRELCRSSVVRVAWPIRLLHLEMARRFVERGWLQSRDDYFFLTFEDVDEVVETADKGPRLQRHAARRKEEWAKLEKIDMPLLMRESELPAIVRKMAISAPAAEAKGELRGLCVSRGYVEGEVIVLRNPAEFSRMKRGAILVTTATDPSWTPLFTLASGIIVEVGGILSHASTVAREYGLPTIANLKNATKILKDGDRIRLDATNGIVQIL
jgi:phosphohistidine swiveling domain-containing protein